jgi:hypothetical protein
MVMEGCFHQQVCPFGSNIYKKRTIDKIHVENFQGRHFCLKNNPCGNPPQHCTELEKLTISLLFGTIGDYFVLIGDYLELIRTNWFVTGH